MGGGLALLAKSQLRDAARHPVGAAATLVGVALAVLAVTAVHLVSQSVRAGLVGAGGGVDWHTHVATRPNLSEEDYFDLRRRWRRGELRGVEALYPVVDGYVRIDGRARRLIGFDPLAGLRGVGADPVFGGAASSSRFLLGDALAVAPPDAQAIRAAGGRVANVPVALHEVEDVGVVLADLPTAQRLVGREGELDAVWLQVENPRSRLLDWANGLLPGIAAALPEAGNPVIDGFRVTSLSRWNPARRFADATAFNLGMLALLSLLMAVFLAVQSSRANTARRRLEHERLRAAGVARAELRTLAVAEGLLVGALGAGAGLAAGAWLADALVAAGDLPAADVDAWVLGKALFCATVAGVSAAGGGGRRASAPTRLNWCVSGSRKFPGKARSRADVPGAGSKFHIPRRGVAGLAAVLALAACLAHASLPSAFAALLLICLLHVAYAVPALGAATRRTAGFAKSLTMRANLRGVDAAARAGEGGDIRLALAALSIAAAVAVGMGLMVESLRRDFHAMLDQVLWEGVYLRAEPGGAAPDVEAIRALPGVRDARRYGEAPGQLAQGPATVRLAHLDAAEGARYGFRGGAPAGALLSETAARAYGLGVGDVARLNVADRRLRVPVAHVYRDYRPARPTLILPMAFQSRLPVDAVAWDQVVVLTEPGAAATVAAALRQRHPAADMRDHAEIRAAATAAFDRSFAVSNGLTAVAVGVAVVGLYAALTALQANREREFRLLAAVGLARMEIWRLALARAFVLGVVAAAAAAPLGVAIAWLLCAFVNPLAFGWTINLRVAAGAFGFPLLLCLAGALLAGAVPTYRSAFRGVA